jgi:hypothetical protein
MKLLFRAYGFLLPFGGLIALALPAAAEEAIPSNFALLDPLKKVVDAFNRQELTLPSGAFTANCSLSDVVSPYSWSGSGAAAAWYRRRVGTTAAEQQQFRDSNEHLKLGDPRYVRAEGDHVYFVIEGTLTYTDHEFRHGTIGLWTITETKIGDRWLIESCSWGVLRES